MNNPELFADRRKHLLDRIGPQGIAVLPAGTEAIRNYDVNYPFRQDSNFHYLTGFPEPEAVALFAPGSEEGDYLLFVHPRDREVEIWTGLRHGVEGAQANFQADAAFPLSALEGMLPRLLLGRDLLYFPFGCSRLEKTIQTALGKVDSYRIRMGQSGPNQACDLNPVLAEFRLLKDPTEVEFLSQAGKLSAEGHLAAMKFAQPGRTEAQVAATMEAVWRQGGSVRDGYPSIVASGSNAVILHYTENRAVLEEGDLLLIDAACEMEMYSADITRTFPVNGKFSPPQLALYQVVWEAQQKAIALAKPGANFGQLQEGAIQVLTAGLVDLGLLPGGVEDSLAMHHYNEFFMHGIGHWLGLDVHDAGDYRSPDGWLEFEPGMAFTVEPGLYINPDRPVVEFTLHPYDRDEWARRRMMDPEAAEKEKAEKAEAKTITHPLPPEFLGLGIRVEDDLVITPTGSENLTAAVPSAWVDIEALCA